MTPKLYRAAAGAVLERDGSFFAIAEPWDLLINRYDLHDHLAGGDFLPAVAPVMPLAPVGTQEVWAADLTYTRSRQARMEESREAGGGSFYDRVYEAERPGLFFKAPGWRVRGTGESIHVREDASWSVPEPELAVCLNVHGDIVGYTIGNDVSSRDIEGENPLYLPQAKVYDGSCALGPALLVTADPLPSETEIALRIDRGDAVAFEGVTTLAQLRRTPAELGEWLYRELSFPTGCVLLTGTGIVPPDDFTLHVDDLVSITIAPIGTLVNRVE